MTGQNPPDPRPSAAGWLPRPAEEIFGEGASAAEAYGLLTADVPAVRWTEALTTARDELGCTFFDWLSAVDEPGEGFRICAHLAALGTPVRRLLLRTTVPHGSPELPTATGVYAGAAWHERETHEMFGVSFTGHPNPAPLLLPDGFEGHPLRKDFVLAARVAKAWPGAKEPGEPAEGGPRRRQTLPPGVPDPNEWGPLKGQLPAPPAARPARGRAAGAAGERPPRRTRSASAGSASQRAAGAASPEAAAPRRSRSASEGSASQRAAAEPGRRSTDAPWLKPVEPSGETSAEAARRVHATDERTEVPLGEGGGASAANAPEGDAPEPDREASREPGTGGTGSGGTGSGDEGAGDSGTGDGTTGGGA
ncbi:NADH-quinone oxidoreductase subunit C [Streptomyces radiopugnans]|uniref:NADH:ubiquinone oxidoreductase subunit (Chain C) n=1 Tax=Streptomyces radiopugnans TaxID=403935 RepID=A0A1H9GLR7_9ACTN|nr:NADH-quinone oxidoreductase subunit C [Streptomyces radiopugnans]SEQ51045.1 NADH:ubiquinone oxidoreductase subunit (chain C) [Streptomyces radiopugnans]